MKKIDNIEQFDDLLKKQFDSFAPEPPVEVWQNLSQHHSIANTSAASKFVSVVKSMSIVSKAIITLAVIVVSATSVLRLQEDKPIQASNSSIITSPKIEETVKIDKGLKAAEASPLNASISKYYSDRKEHGEMPILKKINNDFVETDNESKPSSHESHELRTDLKTLVTETQQGQNQVEKDIVKTQIVENISVKEPELTTQTPNTIQDIDTLIAPEIPNTFTPGDDDNLNKEFLIKIENESTYRLRVFDSKANLVFESFKKEIRWNGQHFKSGENCESGKYFYIFDYQCKGAKELRQKSGYIVLTR